MTKLKAKKWVDPQDVEITDPRLKAFIESEIEGETAEEQDIALQALIEQLWLEKNGLTDAMPVVKLAALAQMRRGQQTLESDEPDQQIPLKMLRKLGARQYGASAHLAEENIKYRDGIRQDDKDKRGAAGRDTRIQNAEARKIAIINDYKNNKALLYLKKEYSYKPLAERHGVGYTTVREYLIGV